MTPRHGPYETEPIDLAGHYTARVVPGGEHELHRQILEAALGDVELGAFDRRILAWLARWETTSVLAVAGWVARARGVADPNARHW